MPAPAVVIAASNLMPSLRERLADDGELVVFPDTEPIQALQADLRTQAIADRAGAALRGHAARRSPDQPDQERPSARSRGSARDVAFGRLPARRVEAVRPPPPPPAEPPPATKGDGAVATEAPPAPPVAAEPPPRPLDWHGTRRAPRHRIRDGVEIQLDGNPAMVVDLSQVGAQVISQTILRPNQRVRVSMPNDDFVMRFRGSIAWAKFELPEPSEPPRYRAGVRSFADADATAVDSYCQKNKK